MSTPSNTTITSGIGKHGLISISNDSIRVLVAPSHGRILDIENRRTGARHLFHTLAHLGSFRAMGFGDIYYATDYRGDGFEGRWQPVDTMQQGWSWESRDGVLRMLKEPPPNPSHGPGVRLDRSVSLDQESVVVDTTYANDTSWRQTLYHHLHAAVAPACGLNQDEIFVGPKHPYQHVYLRGRDERPGGRFERLSHWDANARPVYTDAPTLLAWDDVKEEGLYVETDAPRVQILTFLHSGYLYCFYITFESFPFLNQFEPRTLRVRFRPASGPLAGVAGFEDCAVPEVPVAVTAKEDALRLRIPELAEGRERCLIEVERRRAESWARTRDQYGFHTADRILESAMAMVEPVSRGSRLGADESAELALRRLRVKEAGLVPSRDEIERSLKEMEALPPLAIGRPPWSYAFLVRNVIHLAALTGDADDLAQRAVHAFVERVHPAFAHHIIPIVSSVHLEYLASAAAEILGTIPGDRLGPQLTRDLLTIFMASVDWIDREVQGGDLLTNWGHAERSTLARACLLVPFHPRAPMWKRLAEEWIQANLIAQVDPDGAPFGPLSSMGGATMDALRWKLKLDGQSISEPLSVDYLDGRLYRSYEFFHRTAGPDGTMSRIGDCVPTHAAPFLALGARLFQQGAWLQMAQDFGWKPTRADAEFPLPYPEPKPYQRSSELLMHYGQAILRHEKNQISLFFGALPSHAHLDTMSFEIWARGEYFSPDPACGPGHASELHTQWYSQTRSHNAVTFDELSYGIHRKAELVSWDGHSVKVRGEIHPGCFLTRRVSIAGDTFWFRDVVTGKKPEGTRKLIWRFNTFARPRIESGAVVLQERPDGPKVVIQTHREAVFSVFHCKLNRSSEEHEEAHQVRFEIPAEARELVFEVSAEVR